MKKLLTIFFLAAITFVSCKKEETTVSKVVNVSAPAITLKGDKYISIPVGGSYTDPGATAVDDITNVSSDIMAVYSSLDASKAGLYYMQYTAKDANGYVTNVARYIAVTNYADTIDLSGVYERAENSVDVNLSRVAKGLYKNDDMGGAELPDAGYFAVINDSTIDFGPQFSETIGSEISASDTVLHIGPADTTFQYALNAPGYGPTTRHFTKVQ